MADGVTGARIFHVNGYEILGHFTRSHRPIAGSLLASGKLARYHTFNVSKCHPYLDAGMIHTYLFSTLSTLIMGLALLLQWRKYPNARFNRDIGFVYILLAAIPMLVFVHTQGHNIGRLIALFSAFILGVACLTFLILGVVKLANRPASKRRDATVMTLVSCFAGIAVVQESWPLAFMMSGCITLGSGLVAWRWLGSSPKSERWVGPLICLMGIAQFPTVVWGQPAYEFQATTGALVRLVLGLVLLHTALQRAIAEARQLSEKYERLTVNSHQGVTVGYQSQILYCNPAFLKIYGVSRLDELTPEWINSGIDPHELADIMKMRGQIMDGTLEEARFEGVRRRKDGTSLRLRFSLWRTEWNGEPAIQTVITDDTAQHNTMAALLHQATHDELTGLPNRAALLQRLRDLCQSGSHFGLVLLDIDRFKLFNDAHGHSLGDEVLKTMSDTLQHELAGVAEVCRIGADGFAALDATRVGTAATDEVTQRVRKLLARPLVLHEQEFFIDMSMGIALFPQTGSDPESLLRAANAALHEAKKVPGTSVVTADERFERGSSDVLKQEQALRAGIGQREFRLTYQPKVDAATGALLGFEALARWLQPGIGEVNPAQFIAAAERTGLIGPLGILLLSLACEQVASWRLLPYRVVPVAVNVSPLQLLDPGFPQLVDKTLKRYGVPSDLITLEVTESAAIDNMEQARSQISQLRDLGLKVAMDDFGTGFSSLDMLRTLPLNVVKIDRSLISPLPAHESLVIVQAICQIAAVLKLRVVAEGVETSAQAKAAHQAGCHEIQGYFYARPLTPEQALLWLKAGARP